MALAAVCAFSGCASLSGPEVNALRAGGVPDALVLKLEREGILSPNELIELHRRRVPVPLVVRHLDRVGIDYVLDRDDVRKLEAAKVPDEVVLAARRASSRFQRSYLSGPAYIVGDPFFYDPFFISPRVGLGIGWGGRRCR